MSDAPTKQAASATPPRARGIILAAGRGSRLRPLTDHTPKPLALVADRPLIAYGLGLLRANGIEEVVVNVHHLGDRLREALGDGSRHGVAVRYSVETTLLDTGGGIRQATRLFEGSLDAPVVVLNADVVTDVPLGEVLDFHASRRAAVTFVLRDDPRKESYGVFGIDTSGRVRRFLGRGAPREGLSEYMFASVQVLSPEVIARMPDDRPFSSMHDFYPPLFAEGLPFFGYVYAGRWHTADNAADLAATDAALRRDGLPRYMR